LEKDKKKICPFMTARTTHAQSPEEANGKAPLITPTVVFCQEEGCAVWSKGYKACGIIVGSIKLVEIHEELIKVGEAIQDH